MTLQYQLANGSWVDCNERTEEFLSMCEKNNPGVSREGLVVMLKYGGEELRNAPDDWYSNCRMKPEPKPAVQTATVKCSCGHTVARINAMSTSMGTSCPDCYDRMSE